MCKRYKWKALVENDEVQEAWRKYMEKLLNKEKTWDNATVCKKVEGPYELIRSDELLKGVRMMKGRTAPQELFRKFL